MALPGRTAKIVDMATEKNPLGIRVMLVDDVMTTGATLNEIARNLKRAGAARVTGLIVARTLPDAFRKRVSPSAHV